MTSRSSQIASLKRTAKRLFVLGGGTGLLRAYRRGDALVLTYHNIIPDGVAPMGEVTLHISREQFATELDILERTCDVVPLAEVSRPGRGGRPRIAITFDDAYKGAVTIGVEELGKRGFPATIFVAPHFVGGASFWWDAVDWPGGKGSDGPVYERAFRDYGARDALVRRAALESGLALVDPPDYCRCASEEELSRALRIAPVTLGSHTWSHPTLPALDAAELREELERPLHWLLERFERVERTLAYPYGHHSPAVTQMTRDVGYSSAVRVGGGWIRKGTTTDPFRVPRFRIGPDVSADGFAIVTSGLIRERRRSPQTLST